MSGSRPGPREDFCLGVLGLELLAQQGQLGLGAGAEQEHLLARVSREFQRERLVGRAGLKPVLHGLRLQLSLVKRHGSKAGARSPAPGMTQESALRSGSARTLPV